MSKKLPHEGELQAGNIWFRRDGNVLTLGLTSLAMEKLGDLESIELPEEGDHFDEDDSIITVEGNSGSIDWASISKGIVVEVNAVTDNLDLVTEDPLEEGWLIKVQLENLERL
jgi:glycine cleavage system H protein